MNRITRGFRAANSLLKQSTRRWTSNVTFAGVMKSLPDPMQDLKVLTDQDTFINKIDLGAGVYRDERGQYYEFEAKKRLEALNLGHDYNPTIGISSFRRSARELLFGKELSATQEGRIASVQTVAGTGANRIGAAFLRRHYRTANGEPPIVYVGEPTWGNYRPLFENAGFKVETYPHLTEDCEEVDFVSTTKTLETAAERSIFVLQASCHNPTGLDYSRRQWRQLADLMHQKNHFAFFDAAYLGFGSGKDSAMEDDSWGLRHFVEQGIDTLACQSFSKILGLYAERVGALHVVCRDAGIAENVLDQLRAQIRWEVSSAPAWGARLADIVMQDDELRSQWKSELQQAAVRIEENRQVLYSSLTAKYQAPGAWEKILREKGLFSFLRLTQSQISDLKTYHHVYLPPNGRINIAGLSRSNIDRAARAINQVVRS